MEECEENQDCQDTSVAEDPEWGHCDYRRSGNHTRQKHKPLTKRKRKIIKSSRKRNRK